jgi:hypothetical protein
MLKKVSFIDISEHFLTEILEVRMIFENFSNPKTLYNEKTILSFEYQFPVFRTNFSTE